MSIWRNQLHQRIQWGDLDESYLRNLILLAKNEDLAGAGLSAEVSYAQDVTSELIDTHGEGRASIVAREDMVVAGLPLVPLILDVYASGACQVAARVEDGASVLQGQALMEIAGPISALLSAERVILNFLQHLSGIATRTHHYVTAMGETATRLLDTRKTTPGYRVLEKYAVAQGGGWNHRMGLFDRIMLKDNHLAAQSSWKEKAAQARARFPGILLEVEIDGLSQLDDALSITPDVILLDNFSLADTLLAVEKIGSACCTEASGNVSLDTLPELSQLGLTFISCGGITHQAQWCDIGLDWES